MKSVEGRTNMTRKAVNWQVDAATYEKFKKRAKTEGRSMTAIINRMLQLYGDGKLKVW